MDTVKLSRSQTVVTLTGLMLGVLMSSMDTTVIGTSMPSIVGDLSGMERYSWPFTAYLLCSTLAVPIFGRLADSIGRRLVFLIGLAEFLVASALCGFSGSMDQLILFRGLQGIGGGVIVSSAFALVGEVFSGREMGKYMGLVASMFGLSSVMGPSVGGFLTDALGWRWAFYVNLPLGAVAFAVLAIGLRGVKERRAPLSIDVPGIAFFTASVVPLMLALSWGGREYAWSSPAIVALLAAAACFGIAFVAVERRVRNPLLPPYLFRERDFTVSAAATFFSAGAFYAGILFLPLYMQEVMKASAAGSGLAITPMLLSYALASALGGRLCTGRGNLRALCVGSSLVAIIAMLGLALVPPAWGAVPAMAFMVALGIGLGLTTPAFNIAAQTPFDKRSIGTVTSSIQLFRYMGSAVGAAIFGTVMTSRLSSSLAGMDWGGAPQAIRSALSDPKTLMNPAALKGVAAHVPALYSGYMETLTSKIDGMLSQAIHAVFFAACAFSALLLLTVIAYGKRPSEARDGARPF